MSIFITDEQVKEALLRYKDDPRKNPSYGSSWGCEYTTVAKDHCVAGRVIVDLGGTLPDRETKVTLDTGAETELNKLTMGRLVQNFDIGLSLSDKALGLLDTVQAKADGGMPWGNAIHETLKLAYA